MLRLALLALALCGAASCFSFPPSSPSYSSYECHFAYEPELDELRWIEVLHGAVVPDGDAEYFEAFQQGRKVYPARSFWCFDLDGYGSVVAETTHSQPATPESRMLAELAEHLEIVDGGFYAESGERIGVWRRSRIHRVSELIPEMNELVRAWTGVQFKPLHSPQESAQLAASQRVLDSIREFLASGGDALRLEGGQIVLELPLPSELASELWSDVEQLDEATLPFASSELVQRQDGQWVLRTSDAAGWLTTTAAGWTWFLEALPEEDRSSPQLQEQLREKLRRSHLQLTPRPDVEGLKAFEPFTGN